MAREYSPARYLSCESVTSEKEGVNDSRILRATSEGSDPCSQFSKRCRALGVGRRKRLGERQRQGLDAFLHRFLVIPFDFDLTKVWACISVHCKKRGRRLEAGDAWIVATAVHRRIPLLTHDGDQVGLEIPDLDVVSYVNQRNGEK